MSGVVLFGEGSRMNSMPSDDEEGIKVQDLRDLVTAMKAWRETPQDMTNLVIVSLSSALPQNKRSDDMMAQCFNGVAGIGVRRGGKVFDLVGGDFAILLRISESAMIGVVRDLKVELLRTMEKFHPGSFGTIDQSRLVTSYEFSMHYRSAADRVAKYAELAMKEEAAAGNADAAAPDKLRPLTRADIQRVMQAYEKFGPEKFLRTFARRQDVCMCMPDGEPTPILTEHFISMDLLRKPLFVDVEMRGSGRLFSEFTLVLDQILLRSFDKMELTDDRHSINLNVESIFTQAFDTFLKATPSAIMERLVFEFKQANIVANYDEFQVGKQLISEAGGQIAVDQIFPQTIGLVDLSFLGATMAKIHWRNGAEEMFVERAKYVKRMIEDGVMPIMIRVDDARAMEIGQEMGITLFQGFHLDDWLKNNSAEPAAAAG